MPTVRLNDPLFTYAAGDVLRLFFGKPEVSADGRVLRVGDPAENWHCVWTPGGCAVKMAETTAVAAIDTAEQERLRRDGEALRLARREVKRQLYFFCVEQTGKAFPWGSLTGIRPTLVAGEVLMETGAAAAAEAALQQRYGVRADKAALAVTTRLEEERLLARFPESMCAVYIGIPFCPSRCFYCSFTLKEGIAPTEALKDAYVTALISEIRRTATWFRQPVRSVYIGGGTPTELNARQLDALLSTVRGSLALTEDCECCLEAGRPDTIDREKLKVSLEWGFDRICINPQTMQDRTLKRIGRRHTAEETVQAVRLAQAFGFRDINMDLIAGLPGETVKDFAATLDSVMCLHPSSVTVHSLAVKRSSDLNAARVESGRTLAAYKSPHAAAEQMMTLAEQTLQAAGLRPYYLYRQKDGVGGLENVGFAAPGQGNLYNVAMMGDCRNVLGFGCGSMSNVSFRAIAWSAVRKLNRS